MPAKLNPDLIRLKDILSAIDDIERFIKRSSFDDRMAVMAIAYAIAIIGEAADKLSAELRHAHPDIPWSDIVGMRHRIIHGYGKVSIDRLREAVEKHLPILKQNIQRIIRP